MTEKDNNSRNKKAVILLSGEEDHAKALHALLYTLDLKKHGFESKLFFDGAGTTWIKKFSEPEERLRQIFDQARTAGLVDTACNFCSHAFQAADAAKTLGVELSPEGSHISVGELSQHGYDVIIV